MMLQPISPRLSGESATHVDISCAAAVFVISVERPLSVLPMIRADGRAYYVDAVAVVVLDNVRPGELVVRPHHSEVHRGAPEHENASCRLRRMVLFTTRAKLF